MQLTILLSACDPFYRSKCPALLIHSNQQPIHRIYINQLDTNIYATYISIVELIFRIRTVLSTLFEHVCSLKPKFLEMLKMCFATYSPLRKSALRTGIPVAKPNPDAAVESELKIVGGITSTNTQCVEYWLTGLDLRNATAIDELGIRPGGEGAYSSVGSRCSLARVNEEGYRIGKLFPVQGV